MVSSLPGWQGGGPRTPVHKTDACDRLSSAADSGCVVSHRCALSELCVEESVDLVFVYGTLLRGESNHDVWLAAARFIGTDRTEACFTLFSLGEYPALVHGGEQSVPGEVFEVSPAQLARLDELEECPGFYDRQWIRLASGREAWVYTLHVDLLQGARVIVSGSWRSR